MFESQFKPKVNTFDTDSVSITLITSCNAVKDRFNRKPDRVRNKKQTREFTGLFQSNPINISTYIYISNSFTRNAIP